MSIIHTFISKNSIGTCQFNRVNLLNEDTQYWLNMGVSAGSVVNQNFYVVSQCHF